MQTFKHPGRQRMTTLQSRPIGMPLPGGYNSFSDGLLVRTLNQLIPQLKIEFSGCIGGNREFCLPSFVERTCRAASEVDTWNKIHLKQKRFSPKRAEAG